MPEAGVALGFKLMRVGMSQVSAALLRSIRARAQALPAALAPAVGHGLDERNGQAEAALILEDISEEPWASLTFSGIRHSVELRLEGARDAVERLAADLAQWDGVPGAGADSELGAGLAGHFLADVKLTILNKVALDGGRTSLCLRLDALTIEE